MRKMFLAFSALSVLLASSVSFAEVKFFVLRANERTELKLARVGVTTQADGAALLVLYAKDDPTGACAVKVTGAADAVALSNKILASPMRASTTIYCMKRENYQDTTLHIEDEL